MSDPPAAKWSPPVSVKYGLAVAAVGLAVATTFVIRRWMGPSVSMLFFPAVIVSAMAGGYGPALLATVLSTFSLAFLFVSPLYSLDVGTDDAIRLTVFTVVAIVTASLSSAQRRAEEAQQRAVHELRGALNTLRKVSGWPVFVDATMAGAARRLLDHAASVVGSAHATCVWEAADEPWVYMASSSGGTDPVTKFSPTQIDRIVPLALHDAAFISADPIGDPMTVTVHAGAVVARWSGAPMHTEVANRLQGTGVASAPFDVDHLTGRMFFSGLASVTSDAIPLVEVVAHEVGNSLERLHLHDRLQQVAIREDRISVARDLHDGVLQVLTGIRFQLQALADESTAPSPVRDRLLAVERAIAIEQRELRMFIEGLKPSFPPSTLTGDVAQGLETLRARLAGDWKTPVVLRVSPASLSVPPAVEQTLRLLVQEAVVNALKHANPSRVTIEVELPDDHRLHVAVSNDGRGFPFRGRMDGAQLVALNAGPVSLRERVTSVGGSIAIDSTPSGSRVEITFPV